MSTSGRWSARKCLTAANSECESCSHSFLFSVLLWRFLVSVVLGCLLFADIADIVHAVCCDTTLERRFYTAKGIGCYTFAQANTENVVDATMQGNSARFINHSCLPNCKSKCVMIEGKPRIIIFANRDIQAYEELTYVNQIVAIQ